MKNFNSEIVSNYILDKTFGFRNRNNYLWNKD